MMKKAFLLQGERDWAKAHATPDVLEYISTLEAVVVAARHVWQYTGMRQEEQLQDANLELYSALALVGFMNESL